MFRVSRSAIHKYLFNPYLVIQIVRLIALLLMTCMLYSRHAMRACSYTQLTCILTELNNISLRKTGTLLGKCFEEVFPTFYWGSVFSSYCHCMLHWIYTYWAVNINSKWVKKHTVCMKNILRKFFNILGDVFFLTLPRWNLSIFSSCR